MSLVTGSGADASGTRAPHPLRRPRGTGTIVVLARPKQMPELLVTLRSLVGRHTDAALVIPSPTGNDRNAVGSLARELLDAIGVVGLTQPRVYPEAHMLRPMTHLIHGTVNDVVIYEAAMLGPKVISAVAAMFTRAEVRLWLVVDTADGRDHPTKREQEAAALLAWARANATLFTPAQAIEHWAERTATTFGCEALGVEYWRNGPNVETKLPAPCADHGRVQCLLGQLRTGLVNGDCAPDTARATLQRWVAHPDCRVEDRWALAAAGRDLYTPGHDALGHTHPDAQHARIEDVAPDGSTVVIGGAEHQVLPMMQPALARLRTSRVVAGCPPRALARGMFDQSIGPSRRRRR